MKRSTLQTAAALALAAALVFAMTTYFVRMTEYSVVTTFGKPSGCVKEPGLYLKWPWPVQKVYTIDRRIQNYDGQLDETYTQDGKIILASVFAGWRIDDPVLFIERFGNIEAAKKNIDGLIRTAKNAVIGHHPLAHLISTDPAQIAFEAIESDMLEAVAPDAMKRFGIEIVFLGIKHLALPDSITSKVFERMKKERERISEKFLSEGDAEATRIKAQADAGKEEAIARANAQATRIMGEAEAQAAEAFTVFKEHEDLALFLQKIDALRAAIDGKTTIVLDYATPPFDLFGPSASGTRDTPPARKEQ